MAELLETPRAFRFHLRAPAASFVAASMLLLLAAQSAGAQISAPHQLEGVQISGTLVGDGSAQVLVGLGRAPDPDHPDAGEAVPAADALAWMTILGTDGWVLATRVTIERRCEFLCTFDGPQECHWVGLYSPSGALTGIGTPLVAIPGEIEVEDYVSLAGPAGSPVRDPMASLSVGGDPQPLLWEAWEDWSPTYTVTSFDEAAATLGLRYESPNQSGTLEGENCTTSPREWLLTVNCGAFSVLASGGKPLLVSRADYNAPATEVLARFEAAGSRHYVVRFGAKAQDVTGLVSAKPSGWTARFRPREWASIC